MVYYKNAGYRRYINRRAYSYKRRIQNCGSSGTYFGNGVGCVQNDPAFIEELLKQSRLKGRGTKTQENGEVFKTWNPPAKQETVATEAQQPVPVSALVATYRALGRRLIIPPSYSIIESDSESYRTPKRSRGAAESKEGGP